MPSFKVRVRSRAEPSVLPRSFESTSTFRERPGHRRAQLRRPAGRFGMRRPQGARVEALATSVGRRARSQPQAASSSCHSLAELLDVGYAHLTDDHRGAQGRPRPSRRSSGRLENLRFHPEGKEQRADHARARWQLYSPYVNDAGCCAPVQACERPSRLTEDRQGLLAQREPGARQAAHRPSTVRRHPRREGQRQDRRRSAAGKLDALRRRQWRTPSWRAACVAYCERQARLGSQSGRGGGGEQSGSPLRQSTFELA